ncbi:MULTISPECIES: MFS transporter [unclassified Rathayibacter]|uniref:MFS transporter n=1 Tax=unclassified Rathayibacter TaxID=2609250 RepID=UPI000F4C3EE4|nr:MULTISPECIES: MFS transporter [unclassified Rathayibacter]ROP49795.1 Na+/melibiose symporter-like transporter [Rathayibacter sp. PhB186]ROS51711.1 Na+/melibiose symporter-like transporter [Rathayibacter sp. PhB185]
MYISLSDRPEGAAEQPARSTGPSRIAPAVIALGIVSLFTDISSESTAAILPFYITAALGMSTLAYGLLDGLYQGVSAFVRIGAGWTADRTDRPKLVALAGYGLSAIARLGLLAGSGPAALTAVVTVDRLGKGIRTAPRDAMISASSEPASLARSFGVHRMLDTVGATIGPLLAFVVLLLVPDGYSTVFVLSAAFATLGVVVLLLFVPDVRTRIAGGAARTKLPWRRLWDRRPRRLLLAAGLLGLLTVGDGFVYLVLQSRSGFAAQWFPLLYVGTNAAYLALAIPFGRLADRWGRARMFAAGHVLLLAVYVLAASPASGLAVTIACLLLLGAFYAATDGVLAAVAGASVPAEIRASGIAAAQTVVAVARLFASVGFGALWLWLGREGAMIAVAVGLAAALPLAALLLRERFAEKKG